MTINNSALANAISKRYKASGVDISPEAIVKHMIALCDAINLSDHSMLAEQRSWQRFLAYEECGYVDDFGCDPDGVFLLGLAKKLREQHASAAASRNHVRYRKRLLEANSGLDITPLFRVYDKWLAIDN